MHIIFFCFWWKNRIFQKFQIREFLFHFRDWDRIAIGQSRMAGLRQDRGEDLPECLGREKSSTLEMALGNADLYSKEFEDPSQAPPLAQNSFLKASGALSHAKSIAEPIKLINLHLYYCFINKSLF